MLPLACRRDLMIFALMIAIFGGRRIKPRIKPSIAIGSSDEDMSLLESRHLEAGPSVQHEMEAFMANPLIQQRLTTFVEEFKVDENLQKELESIKADPVLRAEAEAAYQELASQSDNIEEQMNANPSLRQQLAKIAADPDLQHQLELVQMMLGDGGLKGGNAHVIMFLWTIQLAKMAADPELQHQIDLVQMMLGDGGLKDESAHHVDGRGAGTSLAEVSSVSTQLPLAHVPRNAARWVYNHPRESLTYAFILLSLHPLFIGSELHWGLDVEELSKQTVPSSRAGPGDSVNSAPAVNVASSPDKVPSWSALFNNNNTDHDGAISINELDQAIRGGLGTEGFQHEPPPSMAPRNVQDVVAETTATSSQEPIPKGQTSADEDGKLQRIEVADATEAFSRFRARLEQLVETPLFRVYSPYPDHPGEELYDVQCAIPDSSELAKQIGSLQRGCAIQQCGCASDECDTAKWRHEPCFAQCQEEATKHAKSVQDLAPTTPVSSDGTGPVQYDLIENPEQFTGYGTLIDDGSARMIWESLYTEKVCFTSCPEKTDTELSPEKRLVYQVVSGLQASVNTHIAMHYGVYADTHEPASLENFKITRSLEFMPWKKLYDDRVGSFPDRIRNLRFVFELMTRALRHLGPHLEKLVQIGSSTCSKCESQHNRTLDLLQQLVDPPDKAPSNCAAVLQAVDNAVLFERQDDESMMLKKELKQRFQRMGHLMTCVGCDRCKLWGSLQFHGARVALGILLSVGAADDGEQSSSQFDVPRWADLKPNDIVALVNAVAQVSKSIDQVNKWSPDATAAICKEL